MAMVDTEVANRLFPRRGETSASSWTPPDTTRDMAWDLFQQRREAEGYAMLGGLPIDDDPGRRPLQYDYSDYGEVGDPDMLGDGDELAPLDPWQHLEITRRHPSARDADGSGRSSNYLASTGVVALGAVEGEPSFADQLRAFWDQHKTAIVVGAGGLALLYAASRGGEHSRRRLSSGYRDFGDPGRQRRLSAGRKRRRALPAHRYSED